MPAVTRRPGSIRNAARTTLIATLATAATVPFGASQAGAHPFADDIAVWYSNDGGFLYTDQVGLITTHEYGAPGDVPVMADSGVVGTWRPSDHRFRFDFNYDGGTDLSVQYGTTGDIPLAGRAGVRFGAPTPPNPTLGGIATWRPSDRRFRFDRNADGRTDQSVVYGTTGDVPMLADVNDDGSTDIVIWRASTARFYFDTNLDGRTDRIFAYGASGDMPAPSVNLRATATGTSVGAGLGQYRPSDQRIRVDTNLDGRTDESRVLEAEEVAIAQDATFVGLMPIFFEE